MVSNLWRKLDQDWLQHIASTFQPFCQNQALPSDCSLVPIIRQQNSIGLLIPSSLLSLFSAIASRWPSAMRTLKAADDQHRRLVQTTGQCSVKDIVQLATARSK